MIIISKLIIEDEYYNYPEYNLYNSEDQPKRSYSVSLASKLKDKASYFGRRALSNPIQTAGTVLIGSMIVDQLRK